MRTDTAHPVHLSDYRPADYLIDIVELDVKLHLSATQVRARLSIRANPAGRAKAPLILEGDGLAPVHIAIDGIASELATILATPDQLTIAEPPDHPFVLTVDTLLDPAANTKLMGLYRSGSAYCTQCEAEGFRRITYFLDRPDVLSVYTTRIEAEMADAPVLLGNGNRVAAGAIEGTTRHFAIWHDPFPKPAYLFALVGGDLGVLRDAFTTKSGRNVDLGIYVEHGKEERASYAMDCLKRAMAWDETAFGREYDLDVFNIVAVSDFNMGAMENKGLNIFNDKYVLASQETATDGDYSGIETVIAHEYFHNWTGNRITCRDWFQLCLKEGLTVFRDQEFSSDQRSRAVKRIADVRTLRAAQFPEDAGPLAHNVRPETYLEINNFYTPTVYEKGAEVIRMLKMLIGDEAFARGMDLYFTRYDGTATTVEAFVGCFAESAGRDLSQFMQWYRQAGTPVLSAKGHYDAAARTYTLDVAQTTAPTPNQPDKQPLVIPIALGLLSESGDAIALTTSSGASGAEIKRGVFELTEATRRLVFENVPSRPIPSLLRGFSAPVRLDFDLSEDDLLIVLSRDSDAFNRWQAVQTYATRLMLRSMEAIKAGGAPIQDAAFHRAIAELVRDHARDRAFTAQAIALPSEADLARDIGRDVDPDAIHRAREGLRCAIGRDLDTLLAQTYADARPTASAFSPDAASAGRRALTNALLDLYACGNPDAGGRLAMRQFESSANMTERFGALAVLAHIEGDMRENAFAQFYALHSNDALVVDKWFALQATIAEPATQERVRTLMQHPAFSTANPNRLRSLIGSFATNQTQFHAANGSGYELLCAMVTSLDPKNPQVAARLLGAFRSWRILEPNRRALAQAALRGVAAITGLSPDVRDIVDRSLAE